MLLPCVCCWSTRVLSRSFQVFLVVVLLLTIHHVLTFFLYPFEVIPNSLDFVFTPFPSQNITGESTSYFPPFIWQTWRVPYSDKRTRSWKELNPEFNYTLLLDEDAENFVRSNFFRKEDKPIRETYRNINDHVLKADFFRYLLIYSKGGVYSDMDTTNLKPIKQWIPPRMFNELDVNLVVGVEVDEPNATAQVLKKWQWAERFQLCQWTFAAKPHHPALGLLIEQIVVQINRLAERKRRSLKDLKKVSRLEVLKLTGPNAFTGAIQSYLTKKIGRKVDYRDMSLLTSPKLIEDVLILPVTAFAPGQRHSHSGTQEEEQALVFHHFGFSGWANKREWWRRFL